MTDDPESASPAPVPGPTPTGYQRTQGGGVKWLPPTPEHLGKLLPQYDIEVLVGRGGMGAVYRGKQKALDRPVAIKILPPEVDDEDESYTQRFKNEAKIMGKLDHPAIVPVFDFGETSEGQLYFVMSFIDGTDVHQMIQQQGRLPPEHALAITAHVCDALRYAHEHGVIHRDIKPSNVLINQEGQVKVADFGLAKVDDPSQSSGLTKSGLAMGTPDYVAPETLMMGVNVDGRADLYAVGVMLYQMLTGHVPRGAFKPASVLIPGIDPRFDAIATKAMQHERDERYQSAAELRKDLDVILTTPLVKSGGQSSAAIPKQAVAANTQPDRRPGVAKPARPADASAKGGGKVGANAQPAGRADATPGLRPEKSKAPLFIGLGAVVAIAVVAFVMMGGGSRQTSDARAEVSASAPANGGPQVSSTTRSSAPIKVREEPASSPARRDPSSDAGSPASASKPAQTTLPPDMPMPVPAKWIDATAGCKAAAPADLVEDVPGGWRAKGLIPVINLDVPVMRNALLKVRHRGHVAASLRKTSSTGQYTGMINSIGSASLTFMPFTTSTPAQTNLAQSTVPKFKLNDLHETVIAAQGTTLSLWLDGRLVVTTTDNRLSAGEMRLRVEKDCIIEKVEYAELPDDAAATADATAKVSAEPLRGQTPSTTQPMQNPPAKPAGDGLKPGTTLPAATGPQPARLPDPAKWIPISPTTTPDGKLLAGSFIVPGPLARDIAFKATFFSTSKDRSPSLTFRSDNDGNRYSASISYKGDAAKLEFSKSNGGSRKAIASAVISPPLDLNASHVLEVVAVEQVITVTVNGQTLIKVADVDPQKAGAIGIYSPEGGVRDIAWQSLDPANPADEKLAALEREFQDRIKREADAPFDTAVAELAAKLKAALERSTATVRGTPAEAALRADIARIEKQDPIPPADEKGTPAVLVTLRKTWYTELTKLRAQRETAAAPARKAQDEALATLQKELEDKGDMNRAEKVKAARAALQNPEAQPAATGLAAAPKQGPLNVRPTKAGKLKMIGCFGNAGLPADIEPFAKYDDYVQVVSSGHAIGALRADGSAVVQVLVAGAPNKLATYTHTTPPLAKLFVTNGFVLGLTEDGRVALSSESGNSRKGPWDALEGVVEVSTGDAKKFCGGLKPDGTVVIAAAPDFDTSWLPKADSLPKAKAVRCDNNSLIILTEAGGIMAWNISGAPVKVPQNLKHGIVQWQEPSVWIPTGQKEQALGGAYLDRQGNFYTQKSGLFSVTAKDVEEMAGNGGRYHYKQKRKPWTFTGEDQYGEYKKAREVLGSGTPIWWSLSNSSLSQVYGFGTTGLFVWIE